jgi:ribosomal protein S18 acetylase RimI-like enzyme
MASPGLRKRHLFYQGELNGNAKDFGMLHAVGSRIRRNSAKMQIREFKLADCEEVMKLWKASGLVVRPGDDIDGIKLKLERDPELFLVAEEDNEIVAVVMGAWDGRRGWINHLAVKQDRQKMGIGTALLRELERRMKRKGARKVNAQIYQWNQRSIDFFKTAGYAVHEDLIMIGKLLGE